MLAGPEVRKGVTEMRAYLEERAGDAATQLAERLDKLSVSSTTATPNGTAQLSEHSDETVEQILGVRTLLESLKIPVPAHISSHHVLEGLCIDVLL